MRASLAVLVCSLVMVPMPTEASPETSAKNPLLTDWNTPFGVPPFDQIKPDHFLPAFRVAMARQIEEVEAISGSREAPTFVNTIEALEATGELLDRVNAVFNNLSSAETNDRLQAIHREVAPLLSAHRDRIRLDEKLFQRVAAVWRQRETLRLAAEQDRLLERTWKTFVRAGAKLDAEKKDRLRAINRDLATLGVEFSDHVLAEMNAYRLVIDDERDLAGVPERLVAGAAAAASAAGLDGKWVFTLHAPSLWPFLESADNRELRRRIFEAYTTRCHHGDGTDNRLVLARIAALRAEKAQLLGYATWADYVLEDNMAGRPGRVYDLLNRLWIPAKASAAREAQALQAAIRTDGKDFELEPCDWFYYTEKVRKAKYDLDEDELRPYFPLDQVRDGAFWVAHRLYGLTFTPLENVPVYNPEVKVFEVKDADGSHLAVFYVDYHPRPGKRGGAWSSRFQPQYWRHGREVRPVVANVCNFSRPTGEVPALLSIDEVQTLFHEFGHGLHAMLGRIHYRSLARTPRDFVELPSQIMENWALEPEVLAVYAKHWKTGEPIPAELVQKLVATKKFDQGFKTVEYLAASLLDMEWHTLSAAAAPDADALERIAVARMEEPKEIVPRYRSTYFQHIFGPGDGYSSGYYSYIWAEVLDADAFEKFKQDGIFNPTTAAAFRRLLEKGGTEEAMDLYRSFRGREPEVEPLLERRGLEQ